MTLNFVVDKCYSVKAFQFFQISQYCAFLSFVQLQTFWESCKLSCTPWHSAPTVKPKWSQA